MGFIGYRRHDTGVRVFLECSEDGDGGRVTCTYPIDVVFAGGPAAAAPPAARFGGVTDVYALKKFYKLVHALEQRARESGRRRDEVLRSPDDLLAFLGMTRNSREFSEDPPCRLTESPATPSEVSPPPAGIPPPA